MATIEHAVRVRPRLGELRTGDATLVVETESGVFAAIIDGLGHGESAHQVAQGAVDYLREGFRPNVCELMSQLDARLRGTVGAAVGLCFVDTHTGVLRYSGVGNTRLRRFGSDEAQLISQHGVVGQRMRTPAEQRLALQDGDVVLLHTDGIPGRFSAAEYPQLLGHSTQTVAAVLVRRFGKQHDDVGCIVLRYRA